MDGTRPMVGNDVVRRLAIVRIDAAISGAGGVGSHRARGLVGWLMNEARMAGAGDLVPHFYSSGHSALHSAWGEIFLKQQWAAVLFKSWLVCSWPAVQAEVDGP